MSKSKKTKWERIYLEEARREPVSLREGIARYLDILPIPKKGLQAHWEKVAAPHLLEHTDNVVYCTRSKNNTILVYVDSAAFAAELTMDKELYRLRMQQETKKEIADIKFLVSRKTAQRKAR